MFEPTKKDKHLICINTKLIKIELIAKNYQ